MLVWHEPRVIPKIDRVQGQERSALPNLRPLRPCTLFLAHGGTMGRETDCSIPDIRGRQVVAGYRHRTARLIVMPPTNCGAAYGDVRRNMRPALSTAFAMSIPARVRAHAGAHN